MIAAADQPQVVSPFPSLRLEMAWPRRKMETSPFPLDQESIRYYYLARNGIYALAQMWGLRGQEILFPAYCHGVELETLLSAGVHVRFYPVDANMRVNAEEVIALVSPRTRAIYLTHYLGFPGPVEQLSEFCEDRGLKLIEDCALALFSKVHSGSLGSFGDAAVYCLYKTLPLPHGGALLLRDPASVTWSSTTAPSLSSTMAYTATAILRHLNFDRQSHVHKILQTARNLTRPMSKTLGIVPVGGEHFDPNQLSLSMSMMCKWIVANQPHGEIVKRRRRNYLHLLSRLEALSPPIFEALPPGVCPLFYPIRTGQKRKALQLLFERGVEAVNFWSTQPAVIPQGAFPAVDELRQTVIELPCHQDLSPDAMDWIADQVESVWREL